MASIVSAGTTSATALNMSADTTGILQLASNNGTVALTVGTSQNIGIGTVAPVSKLHIESASAESFQIGYSSTKRSRFGTTSAGDLQIYAYETAVGYKNILLAVDVTTSGGNVGIGTNAPAQLLDVNGTSKAVNFLLDAVVPSNYDIKMVRTSGDGGSNTVQIYWNGTYGSSAAGGCLGAYSRTGVYVSPGTVIGSAGTGIDSASYTIYGFIGVAP